MTSIIDTFNKSSFLNYSFHSSKPYAEHKVEYGISSDSNYFYSSLNPAPYNPFWQISFSRQVEISSYNVCTSLLDGIFYVEKWKISYSNDGENFIHLQTNEIDYLSSNSNNYQLIKPIRCKHFRITTIITSNGYYAWLTVSKFNCFGHFKVPERTKLICKTVYVKCLLLYLICQNTNIVDDIMTPVYNSYFSYVILDNSVSLIFN